jgi:hypothetical protein
MAFYNPLQWPPAWKRTNRPAYPTFKADMKTTMDDLEKAVKALQITEIRITTNAPVRLDGGLRTGRDAITDDPGVAFYFTRKGQEVCIPCDKFNTVLGNLRAIGLTLEYIKRMEKYGTSEMVDAAFTGFTALPANSIVTPPPHGYGPRNWWDVLEVQETASIEVIQGAYNRLLHKVHPDKSGGTEEAFIELQNAYKTAIASRK